MPRVLTIAKYCGICHQKLPASAFPKMPRADDGLDYRCKKCNNQRARNIYRKNIERYRAKSKRYQIINHESHNRRVKKYNATPAGRLARSFSKRLKTLLGKNNDSFFHIVGCSPSCLAEYLTPMLPEWAAWEDHKAKFHISFAAPPAEADMTPEGIRIAFNWRNLRINAEDCDHKRDLV